MKIIFLFLFLIFAGCSSYEAEAQVDSIKLLQEIWNSKDLSLALAKIQGLHKVSEGKVIGKLYEGQWKYYHKGSTSIMTIEQYKNGKLEGLRTVFYPDGKVAEETNYKNNTKEGPSKIYTQKGIVIEETVYKNGNYNGLAIFRDTDGNDVSKGYFVDGKKSGKWAFYEKGKLVKETNMSYPEKKLKIK